MKMNVPVCVQRLGMSPPWLRRSWVRRGPPWLREESTCSEARLPVCDSSSAASQLQSHVPSVKGSVAGMKGEGDISGGGVGRPRSDGGSTLTSPPVLGVHGRCGWFR